jgi:lipoyl(octanoyl) transferase
LSLHTEPRHVAVLRLGRTEYRACWALQRSLQDRRRAGDIGDLLVLTEHDPVLTIGTSVHAEHLLSSPDVLSRSGIDIVTTDRGGDITYHGPGQIVGYPIIDLAQHTPDLHVYLRQLEAIVMGGLEAFAVPSFRVEGRTGVWVEQGKICAIGINVRRWVTMHGFALNVNTDLSAFGHIVPCGIRDRGVTSLAAVLGRPVPLCDVEDALVRSLERVFQTPVQEITTTELGLDIDAYRRPVTVCI